MVFSCDGSIFTDLELNYGTDNSLSVELTAASEWSNTTKAKVTAKYAGKSVLKEKIYLCDYLTSSSADCGDAGTVIADVSSFVAARLGDQFTTSTMHALIDPASIEFKANPHGSKKYEEKCTKSAFVSAHLAKHNATMGGGSSARTGLLVGLAVLVGLAGVAAYAMKRAKISVGFIRVRRVRRSAASKKSTSLTHSTSSKNGAEEKLYEGELA